MSTPRASILDAPNPALFKSLTFKHDKNTFSCLKAMPRAGARRRADRRFRQFIWTHLSPTRGSARPAAHSSDTAFNLGLEDS